MIQKLKIGQAVDDGTGDYLREGGEKINENFVEVYTELGDGITPSPAGSWQTLSPSIIDAKFGKAYAVNTSAAEITVNLPKGSTSDYNKVIKLRDVYSTWQTNPITVVPASGDTMKGDANSVKFATNYMDLELVYCSPGRWEYVTTKLLNKITSGDVSTISRKEFIATEGQTDFTNIFESDFNTSNTQVFRRGNMLYYGDTFGENSDYGSVGTGTDIIPLDGKTIRLREACSEGDAIIIVTFLDGIAQWRSTYNRLDISVMDSSKTDKKSLDGSVLVGDLSTLKDVTVKQFGFNDTSGAINPNTVEIYKNGVILQHANSANIPAFYCDGVDADTYDDCVANGGVWTQSDYDYRLIMSDDGQYVVGVAFGGGFEHNDIITLKWYNNIIGTVLEIDDIIDTTDTMYVKIGAPINLTGGIRVTDYTNPTIKNTEPVGPQTINLTNAMAMFDLMYPIGTPYENALNPNNPATYMGFGTWVLWGEKHVAVGWTKDRQDTLFGLNNNDIDVNGNPSHTAGGTGGVRTISLENANLPPTKTDEKVLIEDDNGNIVVGGCQFDPDVNGPAYTKYREDYATTNKTQLIPKEITNIQPYITVYRWLRVA